MLRRDSVQTITALFVVLLRRRETRDEVLRETVDEVLREMVDEVLRETIDEVLRETVDEVLRETIVNIVHAQRSRVAVLFHPA